MSDPGTDAADRAYDELVERIKTIYGEAYKSLVQRLDEHTRSLNAKDAAKREQLNSGQITSVQYRSWLAGQMFTQKRWQDMVTSVTSTMQHANEVASGLVEDKKLSVFAENAMYQWYKMEHDAGMALSFTVYDEAAVGRLLKDQPELMPRKVVNGERLAAWNKDIMSSALTRGIIEGRSIPSLANLIAEKTANRNESANIRYARTAMTSAQNAGRIERMRESQKMGIKVRKVWIATLDERTRHAHIMLDGQTQDVDHPFDSELGPINYPGDPAADEANVWNCRCALGYEYKEYPEENAQRYDQIDGEPIEDMTYEQWIQRRHPELQRTAPRRQTTQRQVQQPVQPVNNRQTLIDTIMTSPTTKPMTDAQKDEFKRILDGMPENLLELYSKMTAFHGNSNYLTGPGWYSPSKQIVEMSLSHTDWYKHIGRTTTAAWKTKFHEELHQLDHILAITSGMMRYADYTKATNDYWGQKTSCGERLSAAITGDVLNFINRAVNAANAERGAGEKKLSPVKSLDSPLSANVKTAVIKELTRLCGAGDQATGDAYRASFLPSALSNKDEYNRNRAVYSAFTDAIGLATKSRIHPYSAGFYGHKEKYCKDLGMNGATSECFAEIGSHIMRNDTESLTALEAVMPQSVAQYRQELNDISELAKTTNLHY